MDTATGLSRWTRSVFPADLPDYKWSRLNLAGTIPDERLLIIRLAVGALLLSSALFLPMGGLFYSLALILSVIVTGYDYLLAAIVSFQQRKPFSNCVFISIALILAIIAGDRVDAAAFMILYRIFTILVGYVTERTVLTVNEALGETPRFQTSWESPDWIKWIAPAGLLVSLLVFILQLWVFESATMIAVRCALSVLVISNAFSLVASAPLTWYCALNGAYRHRILFRGCGSMRKLLNVKSVVLDDPGTDDRELPKVVSAKSDRLDPSMLLRIAAYAECHSDSRTARAIRAAYHEEIDESLVERTMDIPRCGVEAFIGGLHVFVGTRELMLLHSVSVPDADLTNGYAVYVAVQGAYAGRLMLQENYSSEVKDAMDGLRAAGVRMVTLFSPAQNESVTSIARELKAQLFCKLTPAEKDAALSRMQKSMPRTESILYIERDCEQRLRRSPADVNLCMIRGDNQNRFDADCLVVDGDLQKVVRAVEAAQWTSSMRNYHFAAAYLIKLLLVILAVFGASTMWFSVVLDGAAALATLLISVLAFRFRRPQHRLRDLLKPYESK